MKKLTMYYKMNIFIITYLFEIGYILTLTELSFPTNCLLCIRKNNYKSERESNKRDKVHKVLSK